MNIFFSRFTKYCNDLYFCEGSEGLLAKIDLNTNTFYFITPQKNIIKERSDSIEFMCTYNNTICAVEKNGARIYLYNVQTNEGEFIELGVGDDSDNNINFCLQFENLIYIFPKYKNYFLQFNISTEEIVVYDGFEKSINDFSKGIILNNIIYAFDKEGNVCVISTQTNKVKFIQCNKYGDSIEDIYRLVVFDSYIWALCECGDVYKLSIDGADNYHLHNEKICNLALDENDRKISFAVTHDKIFGLPMHNGVITVFDMNTGKLNTFNDYPENFGYYPDRELWSQYDGILYDGDNIYIAMRKSTQMLCINTKNSTVRFFEIKIDEISVLKKELYMKSCVAESDICSFKLFLEYI